MNRLLFSALMALALIALPAPVCAQHPKEWEPTGVWPFVNKNFRVATVYTGVFKKTKTQVPCNIHVGNMTLWYSQNDTLLEAIPGSVLRVEFPNGDTYIPVGSGDMLGRVVREDSINGRIARLVCVRSVNRRELDKRGTDAMTATQGILQSGGSVGIPGFDSYMASVADANGGIVQEEQPLPMVNEFYFQVNGDFFPATTKNILSHIPASRRKEYKVYTRKAEIISTNESSMLRIWQDFFLSDEPVLDKKMNWTKKHGK